MATKRDYYEVLGLTKTATAAEIKAAYRKMALKFHPDHNKEKDAEAKFKEINEAYQILSDEKKKQTYDQFGHAAFDPSSGMGGGNPFAGGARGGGPFSWNYTSSAGGNPFEGTDFSDPFDIFESFFGGAGFGGGSRQRRQQYALQIEFMDAVKGAEKKVDVNGKQRTIKIPPGADSGTRIRFEDFDITLQVSPDKKFKRDNYDLYIDKDIPFSMAALGGTIEVETVESKLKLKVRAGTPSHSLIRLRGEGIQHLQSRGKGDLYVRLIVKVPEKVSREEKKLLEQLEKLTIE